MATFLSCWDHADIRLEGLKGQRKSNEGATISARKAGGRATVLCCRRQVKLCAPKSRSGRAKSSAKSRGYLCFADRFLCAPQTASPHASALQLVSLFCTDLQRSLIIGHIIKTPQSRCMYHWDGPLVVVAFSLLDDSGSSERYIVIGRLYSVTRRPVYSSASHYTTSSEIIDIHSGFAIFVTVSSSRGR